MRRAPEQRRTHGQALRQPEFKLRQQRCNFNDPAGHPPLVYMVINVTGQGMPAPARACLRDQNRTGIPSSLDNTIHLSVLEQLFSNVQVITSLIEHDQHAPTHGLEEGLLFGHGIKQLLHLLQKFRPMAPCGLGLTHKHQ